MNSTLQCALGIAIGLASACAHAQGLTPEAIAADAQRRAEAIAAATPAAPWGCVVLLCLANPQGPTAIAQCVDPIRQLWSALRARRPFPSCPMAQGPHGGAYARIGSDYYDPCPAGTTELPVGRLALSDNVTTVSASNGVSAATPLAAPVSNLASNAGTTTGGDTGDIPMPPRVCAAGYLGERYVGSGDSTVAVSSYQQLVLVPPATSPNYVEILLDSGDGRGFTTWSRTRY